MSFLPTWRYAKRGITMVVPSVHLCVTNVLCIKMAKCFFKILSPPDSPIILVSDAKYFVDIRMVSLLTKVPNTPEVGKISIFWLVDTTGSNASLPIICVHLPWPEHAGGTIHSIINTFVIHAGGVCGAACSPGGLFWLPAINRMVFLFGTAQKAQSFSGLHSIDVAGSATLLDSHIKLLGVTSDSHLSMSEQTKLVSVMFLSHSGIASLTYLLTDTWWEIIPC